MTVIGCKVDERQVTMKNLEKFKSAMNIALPIGSSKSQVDNYLDDLKLENTYVDDDKILYTTSLLIRIKLDDLNKVKYIEYELENSGL